MDDTSQSPYGLCEKCHASLLEINQEFCAVCGARQGNYQNFSAPPPANIPMNFPSQAGWVPPKESSDTGADLVGTIIRAVLCVIAAFVFFSASGQMSNIHSIAGDSIAEAFYQAMGTFSAGAGWLCLALAIPTRRIHF